MPETLDNATRDRLKAFIATSTNPFNVPVHLYLTDLDVKGNTRLGTYGVVKGADTFAGVSVRPIANGLIAAGYTMERFMLYATSLGLGTVWLGGTFKRSAFATAMKVPADEEFPAITPIGRPAGRQRFIETVMRRVLKSHQRQPWHELFFERRFGQPLTEASAAAYATPLEMVRLAPSARNAQPWRVVRTDAGFHFYVAYPLKAGEPEAPLKLVDMGIALAHFHLAALELGLSGSFANQQPDGVDAPADTRYILSWIAG